jgi:hypothetical protein
MTEPCTLAQRTGKKWVDGTNLTLKLATALVQCNNKLLKIEKCYGPNGSTDSPECTNKKSAQ